MDSHTRVVFKLAGAVALAAAAVWFVGSRFHRFRQAGEGGAQVWFYDQQKKEIYAVSRDTIPPDNRGRGGVRAVVVTCRGGPQQRRIAYLETYGQPLKDALERVKAARNAGKVLPGPVPARTSEFFQTNDLVRRVEEVEWHTASSPEGRRIVSEWKSWRAPDGRKPAVCLP